MATVCFTALVVLCLLSTALDAGPASASQWTRVAYDDGGAPDHQPHLVESGGNWRFTEAGIPDEALRTAAYGTQVVFEYTELNPQARYKIKMRFYTAPQDPKRVMSLMAGNVVALATLTLEPGKVVEEEIDLPPAAYADGRLALVFELIAGSNALVSDIAVLSTDSHPLGVPPPPASTPAPPFVLPRYSPRPVTVAGVSQPSIDLAGTWRFNSAPPQNFAAEEKESGVGWANIQVPGEWVMQGFTVERGKAAGYQRSFAVPRDWGGKRIKLRCDGVYSDGTVWVNGKFAGRHVGGFTPFEWDVTDLVKPGSDNTIALAVTNESLADSLASGTGYADHPLGGITRKIKLFVLPPVNLSLLHVGTKFDNDFRDATLVVKAQTANEGGGAAPSDLEAVLTLTAPDGKPVHLAPDRLSLKSAEGAVSIPIQNPLKWDNEHPNLYRLTVSLQSAGHVTETVTQRIGFRQVEIRGNQMFINNVPVKLHGVCRHEVDPLRGRSLTPDCWCRDVELFRDGNCNYIRTSHYPPPEEFIDICDELGMFVEVEAPFCWAHNVKITTDQVPDLITRQELEMVETYRNHPCVTQWSVGNESERWTAYFLPAAKVLRKIDHTRPINFSAFHSIGDKGFCDIGNDHYPGPAGTVEYANSPRPIIFDEYCPLGCYHRRELVTDPGLTDAWGPCLDVMWEKMRHSQGVMGGAIWAGIDDAFFLPDGATVGFGVWGTLDVWRRPRPEYWYMKKAYSSLRLASTCVPVPAEGQPVWLTVENRHPFTDLRELHFQWSLGSQSGMAQTAAAPGGLGLLRIPVKGPDLAGKLLEVRAMSPRGFMEDIWQVALGYDPRLSPPVPSNPSGPVKLERTDHAWVVHAPAYTATINAQTGMMQATGRHGQPSLASGPDLLVLPLNPDKGGGNQLSSVKDVDHIAPFTDTCHHWKAQAVTGQQTDNGAEIRVKGAYAEAHGEYVIQFGNDGVVSVHYAFTLTAKGACSPRQLGVVFDLPSDCQTLSWRRQAHWSYYPPDHIGRPEGSAPAFAKNVPLSGFAGPRTQPHWSWSQDGNECGSNDFRSTKKNIEEASLLSASGSGVRVLSDGSQHVRAWVAGEGVRLLVAQYSQEGAVVLFSEHLTPDLQLNPGHVVSGTVQLEIH